MKTGMIQEAAHKHQVNCNPSMAVDEVHIAEASHNSEAPHRAPQPDPGISFVY